ncbi:hypothetical protein SY212_20020 [Ligilactobacillus agilis]|uniref:DNA-binding protein HU n=1 Tax=Ligilactobacillus agilis TaxID=1601 RepID=A0A6F9XNZ8_9LACO|nr:HU family DNA-binding protein [Ligilactobacillus agilis]MDM8279159.1 HU family DNA-binding protein [Ligilactobacillus agilis]GET06972.1 hypothetical protein SY212_20020 [Ligilactobacillus agilis]
MTSIDMHKLVSSLNYRVRFSGINITDDECRKIVQTLFSIISSELKDGNSVAIREFGRFTLKKRAGRTIRSNIPALSVEDKLYTIPSKRVVSFKCSPTLLDVVNRKS